MGLSKIMVIAGGVVVAFGILFIAQSQSVVGPESSFMYRNPEWAVNGSIIAAVGGILIAVGIAAIAFRRRLA